MIEPADLLGVLARVRRARRPRRRGARSRERSSSRRRTSRRRRPIASVGSMSTTRRLSSKPGARATTSPASSSTTECPSKTSSSWPPTRLQNAKYELVSRARVTSISSRSSALPTWNGEAERLTMSCAPASARSVAGGPGCQTSSQIVIPTVVVAEAEDDEVAALGEVAVLVEDAVVREEVLAVDGLDAAVRADGARVREIAVEPGRPDERDDAVGRRCDLLDRLARRAHEPRPEEEILGRIAGRRELGEHDEVGSCGSRLVERRRGSARDCRRGRRRPHSAVRERFSRFSPHSHKPSLVSSLHADGDHVSASLPRAADVGQRRLRLRPARRVRRRRARSR